MFDQPRRDVAGNGAVRDGHRPPAQGSVRFWDPVRGAREQLRAEGDVPLERCAGLADLLVDRIGTLHYAAAGFMDPRGRPGLHLQVCGRLRLRCQRCLEPMDFALVGMRDLVLVEGASEFEQDEDEDEACDLIPLTAKLDLWALAEEEAILSLPLAPHHEEGLCGPAVAGGAGPDAQREPSAFAALAKLKGRAAE
jgi:uncharacterized protein